MISYALPFQRFNASTLNEWSAFCRSLNPQQPPVRLGPILDSCFNASTRHSFLVMFLTLPVTRFPTSKEVAWISSNAQLPPSNAGCTLQQKRIKSYEPQEIYCSGSFSYPLGSGRLKRDGAWRRLRWRRWRWPRRLQWRWRLSWWRRFSQRRLSQRWLSQQWLSWR